MGYDFKIKKVFGDTVLEKENTSLSMYRTIDEDIWFNSSKGNIEFRIDPYNRAATDNDELDTYKSFYGLMKAIIGRFYLNGDAQDSTLPKDFIDLKNMAITWHSDSNLHEVLKIQYFKTHIVVSIYRDDDSNFAKTIKVRIRTSGSSYGEYYKEFEDFYRIITRIAREPEATLNRKIGNE